MESDGEYFIHKTRSAEGAPRLQLIESHRIGDAERLRKWHADGQFAAALAPLPTFK